MKEIEVKAIPLDGKERERLERKGFRKAWEGIVETLYFDRDGELKESGRTLRLRRVKGPGGEERVKVGFKRTVSERGVSIYDERETAVEDGEAMKGILLGLGYRVVVVVRKRREVWEKEGITVTLEEILSHPCVPPYGEVEVVEEKAHMLEAIAKELFPSAELRAINSLRLIKEYCGKL